MTLPEYEHEWQAELDALRAEVAALREREGEMFALARDYMLLNNELRRDLATAREERDYWREYMPRVANENERARALLARCEPEVKGFLHGDVRAFLDQRRDEARRCTCGHWERYPECAANMPGAQQGCIHDAACPARDEGGAPR